MSLAAKPLDVGLAASLAMPPSQGYDNVAVAFRLIGVAMARAASVGREWVMWVLPRERQRHSKR